MGCAHDKCGAGDVNLLKAKALFFVITLSLVGWTRFQNSFYIDNGLTNTEIGTLKSVGLLCKLVGEPVLCIIADMTGHRPMFLFCIVFNAISMELLRVSRGLTFAKVLVVKILRTLASPTATLTTTVSLALTEGSSQGYGEQRAFGSLGWGVGALASGYLIDAAGMDALFFYTYALCGIAFLLVASSSPMANLSSGRSRGHRGNSDLETEEGPLLPDLGAAASFGLSDSQPRFRKAPEYIDLDQIGISNRNAHKGSYMSSAQIVSAAFRMKAQSVKDSIKGYHSSVIVRGGRPMVVLLANAILYGVVMTALDTYLYVSIERDFGASRTVNGLITTVSVVVAIPVFWYSDSLIKRYGHFSMFEIAYSATFVRLVLGYISISMIPTDRDIALSVIVSSQLLHGVSFAGYWASVVDVISALSAKDNMLSGSLAVINAAYFTAGGAVGNMLWGHVYDAAAGGMMSVYLLASVLTLLCLCINRLGGSINDVVRINRLVGVDSDNSRSQMV